MTRVLFWDIDGTLLTTGRAGIFAWEDAAFEVTGKRIDFSTLQTAGLPDTEIARRVLLAADTPVTPESERSVLRLYEDYIPRSLPKRAGRVLPGVREILEYLKDRDDVVCMLLTGNTKRGASAKLGYYGLSQYFSAGAFADGLSDRESIARAALNQARGCINGMAPERVYVIGDTPHDISCSKTIGARAIVVATGDYSFEELSRLSPWHVLDRLPEPPAFASIIEQD